MESGRENEKDQRVNNGHDKKWHFRLVWMGFKSFEISLLYILHHFHTEAKNTDLEHLSPPIPGWVVINSSQLSS